MITFSHLCDPQRFTKKTHNRRIESRWLLLSIGQGQSYVRRLKQFPVSVVLQSFQPVVVLQQCPCAMVLGVGIRARELEAH